MKLTFTLGDKEKTEVEIERNWFTGGFTYSGNGKCEAARSAFNKLPNFKKKYEFEVGIEEMHKVEIVHTRPFLFSGYRPHLYEFFVDGKLVKAIKSY